MEGETCAQWLTPDESARQMLARQAFKRKGCLSLTRHLPSLRRLALRPCDVVEIIGPSGSAKSELLIQVVVNCILPKEWNGIAYGGSDAAVIFFDLDCRFNIMRLAHCLKHRLHESHEHAQLESHKEELFTSCMERFYYMRCYNSVELLAALKTIRPQFQKANKKHANGIHLLIIDRRLLSKLHAGSFTPPLLKDLAIGRQISLPISVSAFYWIDRACKPNLAENKRKCWSFQVIWESIVQELRYILQINPLLVLATKAAKYGLLPTESARGITSSTSKSFPGNSNDFLKNIQEYSSREYMPAVWQAFVTHRFFLDKTEERRCSGTKEVPVFRSKWETPSLEYVDKFIVIDDGISLLS